MSDEGTAVPAYLGKTKNAASQQRLFYTVHEIAEMFRVSNVTLYRAISEGQFPAIRVRGRLVVPAKAIESMVEIAVDQQAVVDAADWAEGRRAA